MKVKQFIFNPFQVNCYLLADERTKECVLIDAGMSNQRELRAVTDFIGQEKLTLKAVWLTHCHLDHVMGTGLLANAVDAPIGGPVEDSLGLPDAESQARMFGLMLSNEVAPLAKNIKEGDVLKVGENEGDRLKIGQIEVQVYDIPGHSFHGLCYYLPSEGVLFTGDVLFCCSMGRSDFGPGFGCDGEALVDGIRCKLMSLPPETVVYPGHGPATTIGQEIKCNPYF